MQKVILEIILIENQAYKSKPFCAWLYNSFIASMRSLIWLGTPSYTGISTPKQGFEIKSFFAFSNSISEKLVVICFDVCIVFEFTPYNIYYFLPHD